MFDKIDKRGFVYIRKGETGRLKLAAIRPTIKEVLIVADIFTAKSLLIPILYIYVKDVNGVRHQTRILRKCYY